MFSVKNLMLRLYQKLSETASCIYNYKKVKSLFSIDENDDI